MDKFIVSARKYRPQNFSSVIGQSHISTTLKNAIKNDQLAHAFLFCGPRGVGKTTCARILAKTINCDNKTPEGEACNICNSCTSFDQGISFNIHELDAASNNGVDDIKGLIEQIRIQPQAGKYKVYIVDEVHMLSNAAFNAFLKTLEEPPPFAIFILATTEKHKIIPTILSRCQIFDFKRITTQDTVAHLEEIINNENIKAEKTALHLIAQKSEGCLRDALSILDKMVSFTGGDVTYSNTLEHLNILDEDYYFKLLDQLYQQQLSDAMLLFDEINQKGFETDTLLEGFAEFIRNLMVSKDAKVIKLLDVAEDFKSKYLQFASSVELGWLLSALNLISETSISFKQAKNKKLHVELLLIKLSYLQQALNITINDNNLIKKKIVDQSKSIAFKGLPSIKLAEQPISINHAVKKQENAVLIIEQKETEEKKNKSENPIVSPIVEKANVKFGSLSKIRAGISNQLNHINEKKKLTSDSLSLFWKSYIAKLNNENNHSAATNFQFASLNIKDESNFEIITESNIQQKFIEAERSSLIEQLHMYFNDSSLKYQIILIEKVEERSNADRPMNSKEHFKLLCESYPLIQDLKEKLKLTLEF